MDQCPFFNTHHAPVGAWASLTFGAPGVGMSVDLQDPGVKRSGALMAGVATGQGPRSIVFADVPRESGVNLTAEGSKEGGNSRTGRMMAAYGMIPESEIRRTLTPSVDTFTSGNISLSVYTPYAALPDPENGPIPPLSCLPGILIEVTVDNTAGTDPCLVFFGAMLYDAKRAYAFQEDGLCGIRFRNEWAFAARQEDGVFLIRGMDAAAKLAQGVPFIQQNGPAFLCVKAQAGEKKTLTLTWSVFAREGSNGLRTTTYYYNRYFHSLTESARAVLDHAADLREMSAAVDRELLREGQDPARVSLFCQAVRAYYASSQLLEDENGRVRWNVAEGAYLWRNTMDLCADHIAWELRRNAWIVRCLMDEFIEDYSYTDTVTYPGLPGEYPGGISFTHDMGCYFTYSQRGFSAYERSNESEKGFYFYMTTEELLNGIYCLAGYALYSGDDAWLKRHASLLPRLMESLENRDAPDEASRNGILKASSTRGGTCGLESTTYDALDHSLLEASGNLYVFVKTWCALRLIERLCAMAGDEDTARRARAMLARCRASLALFHSDEHPWLKANAYQDLPGAVAAAAEALAIPHMLGVMDESSDPDLIGALRAHSAACLETGVCRDAVSGGLRLSSTSRNTWPSKSVLTIYAMERVLGLTMPEGMVQEVVNWAQVSARDVTISDQIHCDTRDVVGGLYYPRIVTAALWL